MKPLDKCLIRKAIARDLKRLFNATTTDGCFSVDGRKDHYAEAEPELHFLKNEYPGMRLSGTFYTLLSVRETENGFEPLIRLEPDKIIFKRISLNIRSLRVLFRSVWPLNCLRAILGRH